MEVGNRWTLLEHIDDIRVPFDRHFDLLIEDGLTCRSWRLKEMPVLDGPFVKLHQSDRHRSQWLEINEGLVSGKRGRAKRVLSGIFSIPPLLQGNVVCWIVDPKLAHKCFLEVDCFNLILRYRLG